MWETLKKYDWKHLLSDLIVVVLSTVLTFLLERVKALDVQTLGAFGGGAVGFALNRLRHLV